MIVLDSSAVVAISLREPEFAAFSAILARPGRLAMSAATYLECAIVLVARFTSRADLDFWLLQRNVEIVPVDHALAKAAADAFERYGKGRHPAGLNFGDCFSYALAKSLGAPLLYKGNDFAKTDIVGALP